MRLPTTFVLLLLTGAFGWLAFRDASMPAPSVEREKVLFDFDRAAATKIEIASKDLTIELNKHDGSWWVGPPVSDRANSNAVDLLLGFLTKMENVETIKPAEATKDWIKHAGLNGTSINLKVSSADGTLASCRVGARGALENSLYMAREKEKGGESIHAARYEARTKGDPSDAQKPDLLALISAPAEAWRDPALLRMKAESVKRLTFSAGTGLMEFKRAKSDEMWELVKPLRTRASHERVNAVLAALLHLQAKPAPNKPVVAAPANATTALPSMKVVIEAGGISKPVELTLQPGTDGEADIPVTVSNRPGAFVVPAKAAMIWKLQPNDLRDPHLAKVDAEKVMNIRIRSAAHPEVKLSKQGGVWMLTRFGKMAPANQERVQRLFTELNAAQVREFAADVANNVEPFGLQQPFLELEWSEGGPSALLKFGMNTESRVFCKLEHEPFIYRVNPSLLSAMPSDGLKWQGLNVLNQSTLTFRRIIITEGAAPPLTLEYNPQTGAWSGTIAGEDITAKIVKEKAEALLGKLANFTAETWVTDRTEGYEALKNPTLTVQMFVTDPLKPDAPPAPRTILIAPTNPNVNVTTYYGRLDNEPDLFLITRDQYREIIAPVVK